MQFVSLTHYISRHSQFISGSFVAKETNSHDDNQFILYLVLNSQEIIFDVSNTLT